jgi:hypothetical protein
LALFVSGEQFANLVLGFRHTAFRFEQREEYFDPEEAEPFRRFLNGEPPGDWNDEWEAMLRRRADDGQRMMRVRVVTEPHSDYTRFLLDLARVNVLPGRTSGICRGTGIVDSTCRTRTSG